MGKCYELANAFKKKYPLTISFRLKKHCEIIEKHLNPGEEIIYAFPAQKNVSVFEIFYTNIVVLTTKRIMIATKRVFFGYFFITITPDMFNDLTVRKGMIFGSVIIDTIKEKVILSNIDPKALPEIETTITDYMMTEKKNYPKRESSK